MICGSISAIFSSFQQFLKSVYFILISIGPVSQEKRRKNRSSPSYEGELFRRNFYSIDQKDSRNRKDDKHESFEPMKINGLELKNRMVVSAMVTNYCTPDGKATEKFIAYHEHKAKGGWAD